MKYILLTVLFSCALLEDCHASDSEHATIKLSCVEWSKNVDITGITVSGPGLYNCEGGAAGLCYKAEVANIVKFEFTGTCTDGWCEFWTYYNGSNPWQDFYYTPPNGYFCDRGQLVPALSPNNAGIGQVCINGNCPDGDYTPTGWTFIPTVTQCYGEPGGGN